MEHTEKSVEKNRERRRTWYILVSLLALVLAAAVWVGMGIWNEYRDSVIDTQKQQMLLTVQSLGDSMEVLLQDYLEDLESLYQMADQEWLWQEEPADSQGGRPGDSGAGKAGQERPGQVPGQVRAAGKESGKNLLEDYVNSHRAMVRDVIVEDGNGEILKSIRNFRPRQVYSVSHFDFRRSLQMTEMENGEKYLVLRMEVARQGAISLILDLEQYYQALMQQLRVGTNGYMVLKDRDGIILMHPERAQWGIQVIQGRMEMYENLDLDSLQIMISHQQEGREGVDEYYSYWWTEEGYPRVRKLSAYCPVRLGEDFLILSAVMDYDDIYVPVVRGVFQLVLLFLVFFLVMVAMAVYIARMMLQKQKDTKQIAYLTELNRLLEEMHRSEETIAHQQRLQIMGTMTGGIAHEFNNLLTPIMGYADLLLMELDEDSESYDNALEIYEASAKAKEIIQQISSLSRKNLETAYKNTDARRMLIRALKMVRSVCPANVSLVEEIHLDGAYILCNETQMNQVILNICVNAIHAIGHREGSIRIRARVTGREAMAHLKPENLHLYPASDNWDHYVCVEIQDNGCGMSREVLNQIFDPFFTTKKGGKGTGLGLALVEQIISAHRGGLYVESEPGKGSSFSVYLPVNGQGKDKGKTARDAQPAPEGDGAGATQDRENGEAPEMPWPDDPAGSGKPTGKKARLRLLVVDDNPKVLQLLKKDGDRLDIQMECRMSFEEARRTLEGTENPEKQEGEERAKEPSGQPVSGTSASGGKGFDALVTEQEIRGQSAVDFCMAVRGSYPDLAVIVMADQVTRELVEARQRGILDGYINKPVSVSLILEALKGSDRSNLNNL